PLALRPTLARLTLLAALPTWRSDAKYCSPACRQRAHRDRNRYTYDPSRIGEWTPKGRASQMQSLENLSRQISGTASDCICDARPDRKSTRLYCSHVSFSYCGV